MVKEKSGIFGNNKDTSNYKESSGLFPKNNLTALNRYTKVLNENTRIEISEKDND